MTLRRFCPCKIVYRYPVLASSLHEEADSPKQETVRKREIEIVREDSETVRRSHADVDNLPSRKATPAVL